MRSIVRPSSASDETPLHAARLLRAHHAPRPRFGLGQNLQRTDLPDAATVIRLRELVHERAPYLRSSFGHTLRNTMRPSFLNDGSVGAKGDIMIERAEEARPRSEIVWVALYSGLVLLLMLAWTT